MKVSRNSVKNQKQQKWYCRRVQQTMRQYMCIRYRWEYVDTWHRIGSAKLLFTRTNTCIKTLHLQNKQKKSLSLHLYTYNYTDTNNKHDVWTWSCGFESTWLQDHICTRLTKWLDISLIQIPLKLNNLNSFMKIEIIGVDCISRLGKRL